MISKINEYVYLNTAFWTRGSGNCLFKIGFNEDGDSFYIYRVLSLPQYLSNCKLLE